MQSFSSNKVCFYLLGIFFSLQIQRSGRCISYSQDALGLEKDVCVCGVGCALSCARLCNPMDHNSPDSSVCGISQSRILKWVAMSSSRGSS